MKPESKLNSLDAYCINQRLNDLDLRIYKLELSNFKPTSVHKPVKSKTHIHSEILAKIAHYVNSIDMLPNSTYSFTINITLK